MSGVTLVLPTRHEEDVIGTYLQELAQKVDRPVEVVIVDDSDNYKTVAAVEKAKQVIGSSNLTIRRHHRPPDERHGGLSGAIAEGLKLAKGDIVIFKDGDGQHGTATVEPLVSMVKSGTDIAVGSRYCKGGSNAGLSSQWRHFVSRAATLVAKGLFPKRLRGISDPMSGCFAVRKAAVDSHRLTHDGFKYLFELLVHHKHSQRGEVPLVFREREAGESKAGEGNGKAFLKQLVRLRLQTAPTMIKFALSGSLIAFLGAWILEGLVRSGIDTLQAYAIQLVVTFALSFASCRYVTWSGLAKRTLRVQAAWFVLTRSTTTCLSWLAFAWLIASEMHHQLANFVCLGGISILNWYSSGHIFDPKRTKGRHRRGKRLAPWLMGGGIAGAIAIVVWSVASFGWQAGLIAAILLYASFCFATSSLEVSWRLHGRRNPDVREAMQFPAPVRPERATLKFSLIVPALDEAAVIGETLRKLVAQTHPNVQIVASLVAGDTATIQAVKAAAAETDRIAISIWTPKTLADGTREPGSKPKQLNAALKFCTGNYIGVFDAEDDVPVDLLLHVEALIDETKADVVQCGVQLVNLDLPTPEGASFFRRQWAKFRGWYCVHNDMEYFFWFSSRMFFQVDQEFVPLGGNTVFVRRTVLADAGGWPLNLTEDCALGVGLCADQNAKVVAAYEPRLATREETPGRLIGEGSLFRQRVRWDQGFLSVFLEGKWRKLPTLRQRLMALYILGMPYIQALNGLVLPLAVVSFFALNAPVGLVLLMYAPFIPIFMSGCLQLVGLREFSREFGQKASPRHYLSLIFANYLYQVVLALAAIVAIKRLIKGQDNWLKTSHDGLHRPSSNQPSGVTIKEREAA